MKKILLLAACIATTFVAFDQEKGYEKSIGVYTNIGVGKYSNTAFGVNMINGYRFNSWLYAGVGIGISYHSGITSVYINKRTYQNDIYRKDSYPVPLYAHIRADLSKTGVRPFLALNAGYTIDLARPTPGFMIEPRMGIEIPVGETQAIILLNAGFNLQQHEYYYHYQGMALGDWKSEERKEMFKSVTINIGFKF